MSAERAEVVKTTPYFKLVFGCSNRAFYTVESEVLKIASGIREDLCEWVCCKCDFEGDLEELRIQDNIGTRQLISEILSFYEVDESEYPEGMELVLSIF